jgi:hypothetical protein
MASGDQDAISVLRQWISANPGLYRWTFKKDAEQTLGQPGAPAQPAADNQGNWGIWMTSADRFARQPGQLDNNVLRRFPSQAAAMAFLERTREENPNMRTDIEVREIPAEPSVPQGGNTGPWGVWVPSLDRYATIGNAGPRRFESETDAQAWIQDYNTRHSGNDLELVAREVAAAQPQEYEVFDRDTGATVDTFTASNDQEVARGINNYRTMGPHNLTPEQAQQRYGLRRAGSTPIARQPQFQEPNAARGDLNPRGPGPWEIYRLSDNSSVRNLTHTDRQMAGQEARMALGMRGEAPELYAVRTRQPDAAQGGIVDVAGEQPAAPRTLTRPGQAQQQWTGEWLVLDPNGRELHRFSGIGNVQADANRHAVNWLRAHPGAMQAGVTVVPEMA